MPYRSTEPVRCLLLTVLERVCALLVFVLLLPLLLCVAVTIVCFSGLSPLIAHRRLGRGGRTFWVLKFRTMWPVENPPLGFRVVEHIVDERGPDEKDARDPRISSGFARFCRRHSVDELPQLLHVICGQMSLVGPRPVTLTEWQLHYQDAAPEVLDVRPGLSGLWQVTGRSRLSYDERRQLDQILVRNRSVKLYLQILLWTLPEIWNGRNAW
jgi:lipopolysaccharide/colanic/teichoic acid biosynthesis glycosyltransferase